jgi:hypothetical protein
MELFSKRDGGRSRLNRTGFRSEDSSEFLKDSLRNRLKEQIKYLIRSKAYFERFIYVDNKQAGNTYLHSSTLSDLSMREAGYDLSSALDLSDLETTGEKYPDAKFFDLIELLIIFAKPEKRPELVLRLNEIFQEEGNKYSIHGFMIVSREHDGLRSIVPLLKEKNLKEKITEYYRNRMIGSVNYEILAQISADIVQLLFSSPKSRNQTKKHATDLCTLVATKWTEKAKVKELAQLFSDTVKNAKELSNQIQNVRHTDRTTIPIETPSFYKLIAVKNINIAELIILSLPETFISPQNPEDMKKSYLSRYDLDKDKGWVVKERESSNLSDFDEFDPNNIPF